MSKTIPAIRLAGVALSLLGAVTLAGCGGGKAAEVRIAEEVKGAVNPYLWRASLDTLSFLAPLSEDPFGGVIIYDWKSFPESPDERLKATVYILDTRLRADGVSVAVFRQERVNGEWRDAPVSPDMGPQIESQILARARQLRVSELE